MNKEEKLFSSLFGKIIKDIRVNGDDSIIAFVISDEEIHYYLAEGDCCSESWFENFENCKYVINNSEGRFVTDAIYMTCNCPTKNTRQDFDIIHHIVFTVNNYKWNTNVTIFNLRNSSNGYYDGTICYLGTSIENMAWAVGDNKQKVFRSVVK